MSITTTARTQKLKKSKQCFFESCTLLPCNTGTIPLYKYQEISMDTEQESNQMLGYLCQQSHKHVQKYVYINISEKKPSRQEWTFQKVLSESFVTVSGRF